MNKIQEAFEKVVDVPTERLIKTADGGYTDIQINEMYVSFHIGYKAATEPSIPVEAFEELLNNYMNVYNEQPHRRIVKDAFADELAILERAKAGLVICVWDEVEKNRTYLTGCGKRFIDTQIRPLVYCPYCGGKIVENV